ncbi:MAG: hypothetical protein IJZ46_01230 [Bacilli bacterium]|nr:hypothetical protein [Bacilli bacterium]
MRKYDIKNKRNIGIVMIISVVIIIMFSLCVYFFLSSDKKEYVVKSGTLVFDVDKSIIKVDNDAIIKTKWNDEYYLIYNDEQYELGDTAISYNENTGEITLYGRYYEISSGDEIIVTDDETVISSSLLTKFYKLADRKYLVIDKDIKSADGLLSTSEFLMVDLDKVGNATLTNHNVSLKVFSSSTIVTSNYTFDIANEILTYGSDKIDLKKIIGSSNTYTKEELAPEENAQNTGSGGTGVGITDNNSNERPDSGEAGSGGSGDGDTSGEGNGGNSVSIEEIKKHTKTTSVISVTSTVDKITVDYVIYDPKNEYTSVYMEVMDTTSNKIDTYYLNSINTTYELSENIFPSTTYEIRFKYSYIDENNELKIKEFDDVSITTKKPSVSLKVTRIKNNDIYYLITSDNSYSIDSATIVTLINGQEYSRNSIDIDGNVPGSLKIPDLMSLDVVELKLIDIKSNGRIINNLTASDKFRY